MKALFIFLRGIVMGVCDLVPGISGGTIAFITGIYERLLHAISALALYPRELYRYVRGRISKRAFVRAGKRVDFWFLLALVGGISLSLIAGSWAISYLLKEHFVLTIAFFVGLILASAGVIYTTIEEKESSGKWFMLPGLLAGLALVFLVPSALQEPAALYIVLSGFLAICAMFLPGISGSFILLILGTYEYMIEAVKSFHIESLLLFLAGFALGVLIVSRTISHLFKTHRTQTLFFLFGLVVGALSVPVKQMVMRYAGEPLWAIIVLALLAFGIVYVFRRFFSGT